MGENLKSFAFVSLPLYIFSVYEVWKLENVVSDYLWHLELIYVSNLHILCLVYMIQDN